MPKVDPSAPTWNRHTLASQLGLSVETVDTMRADGRIRPDGTKQGSRTIGWSGDTGRSIVADIMGKAGRLPPDADLNALWREQCIAFANSPEYLSRLPVAEALWVVRDRFPQLAGMVDGLAEHEGIRLREPRPVDYVVAQTSAGQWVRVTAWDGNEVTLYVATSEADAWRPRLPGL